MAQPGGNAQQGGQQQQPPPAPGGDGLPAEEEHGFPDQLDPEFPEEEEDLDQLDQAALLRLFVRNQQTQNRLIQMMSGGRDIVEIDNRSFFSLRVFIFMFSSLFPKVHGGTAQY